MKFYPSKTRVKEHRLFDLLNALPRHATARLPSLLPKGTRAFLGQTVMNTIDLEHLRYKLGGVLPAIRRADEPLPNPPPTVIASCIIIGHTSRQDVEDLLGRPWRPANCANASVAHYVFEPAGGGMLASLFIEYDVRGIVRALSASNRVDAIAEEPTPQRPAVSAPSRRA